LVLVGLVLQLVRTSFLLGCLIAQLGGLVRVDPALLAQRFGNGVDLDVQTSITVDVTAKVEHRPPTVTGDDTRHRRRFWLGQDLDIGHVCTSSI
jgi:hypothetical protein